MSSDDSVDLTPYSKMAANKLFFCFHVYQPSLPRFHFKILLFFIHADEAKKLINMQAKEQFIGRHFGIRCIGDLHFLSFIRYHDNTDDK